MKLAIAAVALLALATDASAASKKPAPYQLAPFKDALFQYQTILDRQYDGDYLEVDYNRPRDLYARDEKPGDKVRPEYVSLDVNASQRELALKFGAKAVKYFGVGKAEGGAKAIVIFVHGLGATYKTSINDWIHGGNFNRIKNLMVANGGAYLSPDFSDYRRQGVPEIKALILAQAVLSPGAPFFLACSSMGSVICWRLVEDSEIAPLIGGLILFDPALVDKNFLAAAPALPAAARFPIQIAGSREDFIVGWKPPQAYFKAMKATAPDYPVRYVLFSAGTHGLSLRMLDWRTTLNWMLAVDDKRPKSK